MSHVDRGHQEASLSDDVYQHLKEHILNDVVRPPDRLQIGQLSRHFGVSITPIREALIRLAAEHIVDSKPGRGFFYQEFSPGDQVKIHELLFCILRYTVEKRGRRPFELDADPAASDPDGPAASTVLAAALARERLYIQLAMSLGNIQCTWLVGNLCERTRISRILWLEPRVEGCVAAEELDGLIALFKAGENQEALGQLQERFQAKTLKIHALANARQHRIYNAFPLLRPGSMR